MKPCDFKWTRFYEPDIDFKMFYPGIAIDMDAGELVICSTMINADNFSILTTRRLITAAQGVLYSGAIMGATEAADDTGRLYGNFKGYPDHAYTFGQLRLAEGTELKYFIETGKASMVMIHGVRTAIRMQAMTAVQAGKVTAIWNRKRE